MKSVVSRSGAKLKGILFTLLISILLLFLNFGSLLKEPSRTFFNTSGDGFQTYYTGLYHLLHDSSFVKQQCMNYPFKENIFFTGCMPALTNKFKIIQPLSDMSGALIATMNLSMLLSIVLSALFLFLILDLLQVHWFYAALVATGISYLSPQMGRLPAHFTLSYQFAIPAFIYLLFLFWRKPRLSLSLFICVFTFLMASMHLYFLGFFGFLSLLFWPAFYFSGKGKLPFSLSHFFIQLLLPFAGLQFFIYLVNDVHDRTIAPWGFLEFKSSFDGLFFPFGKSYEDWARKLYDPPAYPNWEGYSYLGIFFMLGMLLLLIRKFSFTEGWKKKLNPFRLTDHRLLNVFLWCSVLAALYACAIPFVWGLEDLVKKLGPLRQMRGMGRFAWLLFYVGNITAAYIFWQWLKDQKKGPRLLLASCTLILLYAEALDNVSGLAARMDQRLPAWEDHANLLPENKWLRSFPKENYQAILPLPFFHIGSENVSRDLVEPGVMTYAFLVSLKTGLPMSALSGSRASISQSWMNCELSMEAYRPLEILKRYPNEKPLLLLLWPEFMRPEEKALMRKSRLLASSPAGYLVAELRLDSLRSLLRELYPAVENEMTQRKLYASHQDLLFSDSIPKIIFRKYDTSSVEGYSGKGLSFDASSVKHIFDDTLPLYLGNDLICSFWFYNAKEDLIPRTDFIHFSKDTKDQAFEWQSNILNNYVKLTDGKWALAEIPFHLSDRARFFVFVLNCPEADEDQKIRIDQFMIRPAGTDVFCRKGSVLMKNNRYYPSSLQ